MAVTILHFVCCLTVSYVRADRRTSQASAHNRSGQEDVQKQTSSAQATLYLLTGWGSKAFLPGKQSAWLPSAEVFQLIGLALQKSF